MIRLETINFIKLIITGLIAYIPTITLAGYFSAWIAKKIGDDTAQKHGFLTFNPIVHIDFVYLLLSLLVMPFIGFSKSIPINTNNLNARSKFNKFKKLLLFFSTSMGFLSVFAVISFVMIIFQNNFLHNLTIPFVFKELSPLIIVIIDLLKMVFGITIFCIIIHFFTALTRSTVHFFIPEFENHPNYALITSISSVLLLILFGSYIEHFIILYKLYIDKIFTYLFF